MPALSYGLNLTKKPSSSTGRPPPAKRKTIFDDESNSEDEADTNAPEAIETIDGLAAPSSSTVTSQTRSTTASKATSKAPAPKVSSSRYTDLSAIHTSKLHATAAQTLDPNIYDYDGVYDSLHTASKSSSSAAANAASAGPKYMGNLLAAAEIRKRDQLRAKEKMLVREREAEGDAFAGKESFVTAAYTAQQAELRRAEEAEARREAEERERARRQGGGMLGLYKNMLERGEERHEAAVAAAAAAKKGDGKGNGGAAATAGEMENTEKNGADEEKSEAEMAWEKGAVINEDGQVVDKRELLKAGLNVAPKSAAAARAAELEARRKAMAARNAHGGSGGLGPGRVGDKQAMRERQTRMLEAQLLEASKRAADDEDDKAEALQRAAKSRKTEGEIEGAKERYLRRKREAEEAKRKGEQV